jgi:uncharacterized membrane protein (UPF0127 family)
MHLPPVRTGRARNRTRESGRQAVPRRVVLAAVLAVAVAGLPARAVDPGELVIETPAGSQSFTVELAATPGERSRGLMFRRSMRPDHGMLFDFETPQPVAFWMKNTPLPLDMLFIDGTGVVVQIEADTVPYSEDPIPSQQPIRAVLEVNAGTAKRLGIEPGAKVRHPIFHGQE